MPKMTTAAIESSLLPALNGFKESAAQVKEAHAKARKAILDDPMTSDLAKRGKADALRVETRNKLDNLKADQDAHVNGLKSTLEKQLRGNQPMDASNILLRRDAADRVRKIIDQQEAVDVLQDAIANGDETLAHAIGIRATHTGMSGVVETWKAAYPETADTAAALAFVEANTSGAAFNLSNQITYADPVE
ncbi:hypothetical protein QWJ90_06330 [Microbacterium oryzae]|uniref:hypothetical protein n=1 Tax=Microbacterium oryzae TaxID=743009 RepID=UPI0025B05585|nr:hypothetical protein [Microbacterium oryzae]MDN3310541.1 hypothetical protein [Microbacterium oryzae]